MEVPFYRHDLGPEDARYVASVLGTPFLTSAGVCKEVEARLVAELGVARAKLTNSWTNGAVAALLALGLEPGDEVIVPAMTFVASANVVELAGGTPVLVDVEPDTLLLDLEAVRRALTPRTRGVIPVHLYGQMVDVAALREVVGDEVFILEDAAHCFEGTLRGERVGAHSEAAVFSFYATKNLTCGEGGAVVTRSEALHDKMCQTVLHGMSAGAADRFERGGYRHWDMVRLGTKANLPDVLAALLLPQLDLVQGKLARREALARRYEEGLAGTPVRLARIHPAAVSARHLFPIWVGADLRDEALATLARHRIGAVVNYNAVHTTSYYARRYRPEALPVALEWGRGTLTLPLYPSLDPAAVDHVLEVLLGEVVPRMSAKED